MSVAVRLNKTPGEILALPVHEYELLLGFFLTEGREQAAREAKARSQQGLRRMRR